MSGQRHDLKVRGRAIGLIALAVLAVAGGSAAPSASFAARALEANGASTGPAISADGRFVVFNSAASNLVVSDLNGAVRDVFVRDRMAGTTTLVDVSSAGVQANGASVGASISADGRFVAFVSAASNLVAGDTNGAYDVFVRDLVSGTTRRVSVSSAGAQANRASRAAAISGNGQVVAFTSSASNLVRGDTNRTSDVFVRNLATRRTWRVSLSNAGTQARAASNSPAISADGRIVAFDSLASNLVAGDTNRKWDIFVRNRATARTPRVSVSPTGRQGLFGSYSPAMSANGRLVAFHSRSRLVPHDAGGLHVFVRNWTTGTTERDSVSSTGAHANNSSVHPAMSADGSLVSFDSLASNLVAGDTNGVYDTYMHDRATGTTLRESVSSANAQADALSSNGAISGNDHFLAFSSFASNLVAGDTNATWDIFVRDLTTGTTERVSVP